MAWRPKEQIDAARNAWAEGIQGVYKDTPGEEHARHSGFGSGFVIGEDQGFTRGWKAAMEFMTETPAPPPPPGWMFVGNVGVDSGTLIVIDPCYVDDDRPVPYEELIGEYDTPADWQPKALICTTAGPGAEFVRLSNFGGDGTYAVLIKSDEKVGVMGAVIVFDERVYGHLS